MTAWGAIPWGAGFVLNQSLSRLLQVVRVGPNFRQLTAIFAGRTEALTALIEQVRAAFDLNDAVGAQLDVLGAILQRRRLGLDDETYRRVLKIQVQIILSSQGTPAQVLQIVRLYTEQEPTHYAEHYPMGWSVGGVVAPGETALLLQLLNEARLGAYNGTFIALEPESDLLILDYAGDPIDDAGILDYAGDPVPGAGLMGYAFTF